MNELVDELHACLAELESRGEEDATLVVAPPRRARPRPARARRRRRVLPWLVVLLGVPALAALGVVIFLERNSIRDAIPLVGPKSVALDAVTAYDPEGDGTENNDLVSRATDGNDHTYWPTEYYKSWPAVGYKRGVGIVVATKKAEQLKSVTVQTGSPGFRARIKAGPSPEGPFTPVSPWKTVGRTTTFDLDLHGFSYRYYLVWLKLPPDRSLNVARISEITAKA
jgi:hypothetical protein